MNSCKIDQITDTRQHIQEFEQKYQKNFSEFVVMMQNCEENFVVWTDYLEWSFYESLFQELKSKLS